jgi:hypothetical protein
MRKNNMNAFCISIIMLANAWIGGTAYANSRNANATTINHCYHWINEAGNNFLSFKYKWASEHSGEFSFYSTQGNGAMAGAGIYCAKTPAGSYSYGDRLVRLDFVDDVVLRDDMNDRCSVGGAMKPMAECANKTIDVRLYSSGNAGMNSEFYVIYSPKAVKSWSSNSDQLISDLRAVESEGLPRAKLDDVISRMMAERRTMPAKLYVNSTARMSLGKMLALKDPLAETTAVSLLSMLAIYKRADKKDISAATIEANINKYVNVAIRDSATPATEIVNLLAQFPELPVKSAFKAALDADNITAARAIALSDKLDINMPSSMVQKLWDKALAANGNSDDPIELANVFGPLYKSLNDSQKQKLTDRLEALPLKLDKRSSYELFNDYKTGQINTVILTPNLFFSKLVDRAILEENRGVDKTNLYRLVLSEYFGYFDYLSKKNDSEGRMIAAETFLRIVLQGKKRTYYGLAALQNYSAFAYRGSWIEAILGELQQRLTAGGGQTKATALMAETLAKGLDGYVLQFLIKENNNRDSQVKDISHDILKATLEYVSSNELLDEMKTKDFKASQKEKAEWKNFAPGGGRYSSDMCYFFEVLKGLGDQIDGDLSGLAKKAGYSAKSIANSACPINKN